MRMCDLAWSLWVICCMCSFWSCFGPMLMRGKFLWKCFIFIMAMSLACMSLCMLVMLVFKLWLSCLSMSQILACCSALCIFEKHMLAFVDLIHAFPTRGRKVSNSCFQGECALRKEKLGEMHLFRGSLHSCIWGALFRLNLNCALLPMVSSPFASPWGVSNFGAFYLGCVEPLPLP
jgi:hypothetical protein